MTNRTPGVLNVMQCSADEGSPCETHGAGHAMLPLQQRVTAATPSKWRDGIVRSVSSNGWIAIDLIVAAETVWVWNHVDRSQSLRVAEPVAVHALYHALAIGEERVNVLIAEPVG